MTEVEKYGWRYQTFKKDGKIAFDVIPPEPIALPPTLFRYFGLSD